MSTSQILFLQRLVECADSLSDTDVRNAICELGGSKLISSGTDDCISIFRNGTDNLSCTPHSGQGKQKYWLMVHVAVLKTETETHSGNPFVFSCLVSLSHYTLCYFVKKCQIVLIKIYAFL